MKRLRTQCLYVIYNVDSKKTKIGVSVHPEKRRLSLESSGGSMLKLLYYTKPLVDAVNLENELHKYFSKYRSFGEWFVLKPIEIWNIVEEMSKEYEVCPIVSDYNKGVKISVICKRNNLSRTAIIAYLKGALVFKVKPRRIGGKTIQEMVAINTKKIRDKGIKCRTVKQITLDS